MLNKNIFHSLQRRGGRAIKRMMPKATKVGADGVVSPRNVFGNDHPVCANKERDHFLGGAATPPNLGGEFGLTFRYMTYLWAKRELKTSMVLLLTKSSGKCPNSRPLLFQTCSRRGIRCHSLYLSSNDLL